MFCLQLVCISRYADFARFAGAVGGQFWSICVPCLRSAENFSTPEYSDMARDAIEQIDLTLRLVESYPETFQMVSGPDDVKPIYKSGKIACSIGIEGLVSPAQINTDGHCREPALTQDSRFTDSIWLETALASYVPFTVSVFAM